MAKLYFRYGAMNSGKSTLLLQVAHNYEERGMQVLLLKPGIDTKGGDEVVSRLGVRRAVDCMLTPDTDCRVLVQSLLSERRIDCILVDEAQFLTPRQVEELFAVVLDANIPCICYGLRTDFRGEGFAGSQRLLDLAHSLEELKTICKCGRKAIMNIRRVNGMPVFRGEQVVIDEASAGDGSASSAPVAGADSRLHGAAAAGIATTDIAATSTNSAAETSPKVEYEAVCGECYFEARRAVGEVPLERLEEDLPMGEVPRHAAR